MELVLRRAPRSSLLAGCTLGPGRGWSAARTLMALTAHRDHLIFGVARVAWRVICVRAGACAAWSSWDTHSSSFGVQVEERAHAGGAAWVSGAGDGDWSYSRVQVAEGVHRMRSAWSGAGDGGWSYSRVQVEERARTGCAVHGTEERQLG